MAWISLCLFQMNRSNLGVIVHVCHHVLLCDSRKQATETKTHRDSPFEFVYRLTVSILRNDLMRCNACLFTGHRTRCNSPSHGAVPRSTTSQQFGRNCTAHIYVPNSFSSKRLASESKTRRPPASPRPAWPHASTAVS